MNSAGRSIPEPPELPAAAGARDAGTTLVARLDNDGDVLLAGPAIRAVAAAGRRVVLLHGPRGRRAAAALPGVQASLEFCAPWIDPEPDPVDAAALDELIAAVRACGADEALILTSFHQDPLPLALALRLAGVGRLAAICEDYPGSLLDVRHRVADDLHEVERGLSLAATLGYGLPPGDAGGLAVKRSAQRPAGLPQGPFVVVHPGASVPARAWSAERHRELAAALVARGTAVVVTGSPGEAALTAQVSQGLSEVTDLGGATSFAELAEVLAAADAIVVGNTGPAHLAAAVGCPVVSLFAPTVPDVRWRPWQVPQRLLYRPVACAGCRARICPVEGHPCLDEVPVTQVLAALDELLAERPESPPAPPTASAVSTPLPTPAHARSGVDGLLQGSA